MQEYRTMKLVEIVLRSGEKVEERIGGDGI
jgi:hypothetical protein